WFPFLKLTSTRSKPSLSLMSYDVSQSKVLSLLHPSVPQVPLLWHPLGFPSPLPHDSHPIIYRVFICCQINVCSPIHSSLTEFLHSRFASMICCIDPNFGPNLSDHRIGLILTARQPPFVLKAAIFFYNFPGKIQPDLPG